MAAGAASVSRSAGATLAIVVGAALWVASLYLLVFRPAIALWGIAAGLALLVWGTSVAVRRSRDVGQERRQAAREALSRMEQTYG